LISNGKKLQTKVKGIDMLITLAVWKSVTGLKYNGVKVGKENTNEIIEFNNM